MRGFVYHVELSAWTFVLAAAAALGDRLVHRRAPVHDGRQGQSRERSPVRVAQRLTRASRSGVARRGGLRRYQMSKGAVLVTFRIATGVAALANLR